MGKLYKLLAKVLANKLKNEVRRIVSKFQNAFERENGILIAFLLLTKLLILCKGAILVMLLVN